MRKYQPVRVLNAVYALVIVQTDRAKIAACALIIACALATVRGQVAACALVTPALYALFIA